MLLEQGLTHFGKRELEGHLGFAVAQEINAGRNEFVLASWTVWTQLLAGCLFLHTAEIVLMSEALAWGHGKWKQIFHLDGRRARDGQDGRKQKAGCVLGAPFVWLPTHAMRRHSLAPGVFILHLPFPEAVVGPWDPAKNKADRHTVSGDVLMERQGAGTHSFAEGSVRVR